MNRAPARRPPRDVRSRHYRTTAAEAFDPNPARRRRSPARTAVRFAALLLLAVLLGNLAVNRFVFVREISVPVAGMPLALDGYTLLQISDLKGASFGAGQAE